MSEEELRALFLLAGIVIRRVHKLPNGYCPLTCACSICATRPWWLVETEFGIVKIGWRKRVIEIDWESTAIREEVTSNDVTQSEVMVHAWGYSKAVEYLQELNRYGHFTPEGWQSFRECKKYTKAVELARPSK